MNDSQKQLAEALAEVFNSLNVLGSDNSNVVTYVFSRTHRTLQQQFVKMVIIPILKQLADAHVEGWVDARNERAAALASKMLRAVTDDDLFLPLI